MASGDNNNNNHEEEEVLEVEEEEEEEEERVNLFSTPGAHPLRASQLGSVSTSVVSRSGTEPPPLDTRNPTTFVHHHNPTASNNKNNDNDISSNSNLPLLPKIKEGMYEGSSPSRGLKSSRDHYDLSITDSEESEDSDDSNEDHEILGFVRCLDSLPKHVALQEVACEPYLAEKCSFASVFRMFTRGWSRPIPPSAPFWPLDMLCGFLRAWHLRRRRDLVLSLWLGTIIFSAYGFLEWKLSILHQIEGQKRSIAIYGDDARGTEDYLAIIGPMILVSLSGPITLFLKVFISMLWAIWKGQYWCCWISDVIQMEQEAITQRSKAAKKSAFTMAKRAAATAKHKTGGRIRFSDPIHLAVPSPLDPAAAAAAGPNHDHHIV